MDLFQIIARMIAQGLGNQGNGWVNPGFGRIPQQGASGFLGRFPTGGFSYGQNDVMPYPGLGQGTPVPGYGNPYIGQPNNISTGQPPLPQQGSGGMRPPIDYRNGNRGMFAGNPSQGPMRKIVSR